MDGSRLDAWTRRRFGFAAGSLVLALAGGNETAAKKKRKRCKKAGRTCGGKTRCCGQLRCAQTGEVNPADHCCRTTEGAPCTSRAECCLPLGCNPETLLCEVP